MTETDEFVSIWRPKRMTEIQLAVRRDASTGIREGSRMTKKYIHGYDSSEQDRLVSQASYWMDLILDDIAYSPGDKVLEIGCGVGAVLGILGSTFPGVRLSGIDISEKQIDYAKTHLSSTIGGECELKVGDAGALPWKDNVFDHILIIWVIEHVIDPTGILMEANRVLKVGGSITITETDYSSIQVYPPNRLVGRLFDAFIEHFNVNGDAFAGRKLGRDLENAGFIDVRNKLFGLHFWNERDRAKIHRHTNYLADFIEPVLNVISESIECDIHELERGVKALRSLSSCPDATISHVFYKASGINAWNGGDDGLEENPRAEVQGPDSTETSTGVAGWSDPAAADPPEAPPPDSAGAG